jgi:hypothetical protein
MMVYQLCNVKWFPCHCSKTLWVEERESFCKAILSAYSSQFITRIWHRQFECLTAFRVQCNLVANALCRNGKNHRNFGTICCFLQDQFLCSRFLRNVASLCRFDKEDCSRPKGTSVCWEFFSSPPRSDRLWGPTILLSNGYHGLFPWG